MNMHERAAAWKGGEAAYCVALVKSRGNRNVPRKSVASYLELQRIDAGRSEAYARLHGEHEAATAARAAADVLDSLRADWRRLTGEG